MNMENDSTDLIVEWVEPLMKLTSKRSISNRDESDDMPSDEDEPRSDVVRDRTSIWSCRQYSSDRSLSLRS